MFLVIKQQKKKKKRGGQEKEDPYCKTQGKHTRGLHTVTLILPLLISTFPKFLQYGFRKKQSLHTPETNLTGGQHLKAKNSGQFQCNQMQVSRSCQIPL